MIAIDHGTQKSEQVFLSILNKVRDQKDVTALIVVMVAPPASDAPPGKQSVFISSSQPHFQYISVLNKYDPRIPFLFNHLLL